MAEPDQAAPTTCPHCGRVNDRHSHVVEPRPPSDGDVAICWGCGGISVFVSGPLGLAQRIPRPDEATEILADPQVKRTIRELVLHDDPETAVRHLRGSATWN